jgi:CheY-like chemotaxis protein
MMDGYAVARALRQLPALAATPMVAVTSYAMPGDREKAIASGCSGYVEKPIDPDTLVDTLRDMGLPDATRGNA